MFVLCSSASTSATLPCRLYKYLDSGIFKRTVATLFTSGVLGATLCIHKSVESIGDACMSTYIFYLKVMGDMSKSIDNLSSCIIDGFVQNA